MLCRKHAYPSHTIADIAYRRIAPLGIKMESTTLLTYSSVSASTTCRSLVLQTLIILSCALYKGPEPNAIAQLAISQGHGTLWPKGTAQRVVMAIPYLGSALAWHVHARCGAKASEHDDERTDHTICSIKIQVVYISPPLIISVLC